MLRLENLPEPYLKSRFGDVAAHASDVSSFYLVHFPRFHTAGPSSPSLTTPIARLPDEILTQIFTVLARSTATHTEGARYPSIDPVSFAPLHLAKVCHAWRDLALNTPSLWASFSCGTLEKTGRWDERRCALVQQCLARSKRTPLRVAVYLQPPELQTVLGMLLYEAQRLECLDIVTHISRPLPDLYPLVNIAAGTFRSLRHLTLRLTFTLARGAQPDDLSACLQALRLAPSLRSLDLDISTMPNSYTWSHLPLPWHQITDLKCRCTPGAPGRDALALFAVCPSVARCHIEGACSDDAPVDRAATEVIYAPALRRLMVDNMRKPFEPFMARLDAPRLHELRTQICARYARPLDLGGPWQGDGGLLLRGMPRLELMELDSSIVEADGLVRALSATPLVTTLMLTADEHAPAQTAPMKTFLRALAERKGDFLPRLRMLVLRLSRDHVDDALLSAAEARQHAIVATGFPVARLERLQFEYLGGSPISAEVHTRLQALRERGMEVVIKFTKKTWRMGLPAGKYEDVVQHSW